jgi:hypothetical protein
MANHSHWPTYINITTVVYAPEIKVLSLGDNRKMYIRNGGNTCIDLKLRQRRK